MPDFLELTHRDHLQALVDEAADETLTLEFKASPALTRESNDVDEMCRDVTAFANAAGGQIIYGIEQNYKTQKAEEVDIGITDSKITREWVEQILNSKIQPRMTGIKIERFPVSKDGFAIVITIPATQSGPHQAPDKKYYRRFETQRLGMHDYEIRDVMARGSTPMPFVEIALNGEQTAILNYLPGSQQSEPINLTMTVSNKSSEPALYSIVQLGLDSGITVRAKGNFENPSSTNYHGVMTDWYRYKMGIPAHFPLFREAKFTIDDNRFTVSFPLLQTGYRKRYRVTAVCTTPGFTAEQTWFFELFNGTVTISDQ